MRNPSANEPERFTRSVPQGNVLVARKPFKVFTWLDRGFYRVGDVVEANFAAQTLDQNGVLGRPRVAVDP